MANIHQGPARTLGHGQSVQVPAGDVLLEGDLVIPSGARGIVLFAHGSGSGRHSPRNRAVAASLQGRSLATFLVDLLTSDEEQIDLVTRHVRFDIDLLALRLEHTAQWLGRTEATSALPIGLFGASTGAAAALITAANQPDTIRAVVSRGGRPDLAGAALDRVRCPVLLIVGARDTAVITLNEEEYARLAEPRRLVIVPGASHLFEEPGALDDVAHLAADWFLRCLPSRTPAAPL